MKSKSFGHHQPAVPHLVTGSGGMSGEVKDLRNDVNEAFVAVESAGKGGTGVIAVDEFSTPAAAAAAGLAAAAATSEHPSAVSTFLAAGVAALADAPRRIVFTTGGVTPADAPAKAIVVGVDVNGKEIEEAVTLSQVAGAVTTVQFFASVKRVEFDAADGEDATIAIGFGIALGLRTPIRARAGFLNVLSEIEDGARVVTGTFYPVTTAPPNGGYLPATAPDGGTDYAIVFERDLS